MQAKRLTPILNVSNLRDSFAWFEKLGWTKGWDWGDPPTFGGVCSGECEIFLCENGQGGRGKSALATTSGPGSERGADKGVWMSIWVDDVDVIHARCQAQGLDITWPPTDEPWGVKEMHVRHPDGHVFRITQPIAEAHEHEG
jgi:catechol 2,3-dioxygenase-like lactoylglutathione lyase family enzyme